jgi:hypothetical protein
MMNSPTIIVQLPKTTDMQELYRPKDYPAPIREALRTMPPLATDIANRWMMGWPKRVKALMRTGEFLPALVNQEERERTVYSEPGNRHLARHEIAELYGLSDEPPYPSDEE